MVIFCLAQKPVVCVLRMIYPDQDRVNLLYAKKTNKEDENKTFEKG